MYNVKFVEDARISNAFTFLDFRLLVIYRIRLFGTITVAIMRPAAIENIVGWITDDAMRIRHKYDFVELSMKKL